MDEARRDRRVRPEKKVLATFGFGRMGGSLDPPATVAGRVGFHRGLGTDEMSAAGEPILHTIGYFMHEGGHGPRPADWPVILEFMQMHLKP